MHTDAIGFANPETGAPTDAVLIFGHILPDSDDQSEATNYEYTPPNFTVANTSAQIPPPDIAEIIDYFYKSGKEFLRQEKEKFNRNLLHAFDLEPIEDGYPHPAERIIKKALETYHLTAIDWIKYAYLRNIERPAIAAGILRCLGRLSSDLTSLWGIVMAASGLLQSDIEIRDAAVRALEAWGGLESLVTLKAHVQSEKSSWLKRYIEQVIKDLLE